MRQALLAKQRAVAVTLGEQWFPLRDKLEAEVLGAAKGYAGDFVDAVARRGRLPQRTRGCTFACAWPTRRTPTTSARWRPTRRRTPSPAACCASPTSAGSAARPTAGAFAEQPWNLGQAYAATRILTDDWVHDVAGRRRRPAPARLQGAVRQGSGGQIPLAIDVVKRAQFFLLALDEDVPEAAQFVDGGPITEEALQLVGHPDARAPARPGERARDPALRRSGEAGSSLPASAS